MIVEWETIIAELLLIRLAHQLHLSFAVWKKALIEKAWHNCWFFCPGGMHYVNMNQSLYLLFRYLCWDTASLEDCYFVLDGHKNRRCFLIKRWLNSMFLRISKLNSLALQINNFNMFRMCLIKLKRWYVFLFKFS